MDDPQEFDQEPDTALCKQPEYAAFGAEIDALDALNKSEIRVISAAEFLDLSRKAVKLVEHILGGLCYKLLTC